MKMFTDAELNAMLEAEFSRGFEACRSAAVAVCRQRHGNPDEWREKVGHECANEIARVVPRQWFPK